MSEKVRRYFDSHAQQFDAIYRTEKGLSQKLVDHFFHQVIHRRFQLTLEWCGPVEGKKVLDIGCGPGQYAIELARRGAEVVGLDFAPSMTDLARQEAAAVGLADRCRFFEADFLTWQAPHSFDICLGIGFFDYIDKPGVFLEKMRRLTTERAVFSFPVRWTVRSLTRWTRLNLNNCPVYFYRAAQITRLLAETGWGGLDLQRLSRDYLVHGRTS